ncbi:MAG: NAD(P)/FAD-dependent oxidoreductase [Fidelibacterota bacterium]
MSSGEVDYDVVIVGAGVVGLAVAWALAKSKVTSVLAIEKESSYGRGTSGRNSEVIHSGIYYPKDSLKSHYCRAGRDALYRFCRENDVWHARCGKLVVAQKGQERELERLHEQALRNEVPDTYLMDATEMATLEPDVSGRRALFVGCTGVVSAHDLMSAFYRHSVEANHDLVVKARVVGVESRGDRYAVAVEGPGEATYTVTATWVVNAAGLYGDRVAAFLWGSKEADGLTLHYSKGSYFRLSSRWRHRVQHLVYPLPDPEHDSLGIHLSFDQGGAVRLGPDAEWLAENREDYTVPEDRKEMFYTAAKRYLPGLDLEDLSPDFAGIRPKLAGPDEGPSDFYIQHETSRGYPGWINLMGIDSPGLTAAIAIGEDVAKWITEA